MAIYILTDSALRKVKPDAKAKRLNDGGGLYLFGQTQQRHVVAI